MLQIAGVQASCLLVISEEQATKQSQIDKKKTLWHLLLPKSPKNVNFYTFLIDSSV